MTTPLASLLNRIAADLRKGAAKPPAGFSPIPGSKHGGYHKQVAGHWETWYPGGAGGGRPVRRKFGDQSSSAGSHVAKLAIREPGKEQTSGLTIEAHGPHGGYKTAHWDAARHSVRDDGDTATHATLGEAHDWVHQRLSGGNVAKAGALVFASSGSPCVAPLLRLLQATQTLGATAQHFHWNVKGPHFHSLHEMFGEQYDSAIATQDDIAERIRALGADVPAPPVVSPDTMPASMMVATLAAMQETGARLAREAAACAESVNDQATIDLVGKVQRDAEKAAWMLRATLGEQAQGNPVLIGMAKAARAMMSRTR